VEIVIENEEGSCSSSSRVRESRELLTSWRVVGVVFGEEGVSD
jgi:hypothetical protein